MKPPAVAIIGLAGACAVYGVAATSGYTGPGRCIIVTDGSRTVLDHEKAHCAGWTHEPFVSATPPPDLVNAYTGEIQVIQCGRRHRCKDVQKRCFALWAEHGYDFQTYAGAPGYRTFNGCSVR